MERQIIKTADGSATIFLPEWDEHYHSKHGAVQEALHVFIKTGLQHFLVNSPKRPVRILEIGFGTGLNALLTFFEAGRTGCKIQYTGVEAYPVIAEELALLNYAEATNQKDAASIFQKIHDATWEKEVEISPFFSLQKEQKTFDEISAKADYDLIFFDAFGPRVQPQLWSEEMFNNMYKCLDAKGVLVTYSAKGSVRRAMQTAGFEVERLPGPPGKREMLRATKNLMLLNL